jgi:hypothetical protein
VARVLLASSAAAKLLVVGTHELRLRLLLLLLQLSSTTCSQAQGGSGSRVTRAVSAGRVQQRALVLLQRSRGDGHGCTHVVLMVALAALIAC